MSVSSPPGVSSPLSRPGTPQVLSRSEQCHFQNTSPRQDLGQHPPNTRIKGNLDPVSRELTGSGRRQDLQADTVPQYDLGSDEVTLKVHRSIGREKVRLGDPSRETFPQRRGNSRARLCESTRSWVE